MKMANGLLRNKLLRNIVDGLRRRNLFVVKTAGSVGAAADGENANEMYNDFWSLAKLVLFRTYRIDRWRRVCRCDWRKNECQTRSVDAIRC